MNKKLFSIIALGTTVTCALAAGLMLETPEFIRSSCAPRTLLDGTRDARNSSLHQVKQCLVAARPLSDADPVTLIDNLPVSGDKISNYVTCDVNNDRYEWEIDGNRYSGEYYFNIDPPYGGVMDDWLFIPFDVPDGGGTLNFSTLAISSYSSGEGHNFKVFVGKDSTPESMSTVLTEQKGFMSPAFNWSYAPTIEGSAAVSDGGKYWLGIHATSPSGTYHLRLRNLSLKLQQGSAPVQPAGEIFSMHPTEEEFAACTIIDGNNDGCKLGYDVHTGMDGSLFDWPIYYNSLGSVKATADADEWIVTPAVTLSDISRLYTAAIEATSTSTYSRESFEIVMAKSNDLESLRAGTVIMSEPSVCDNDYIELNSKFAITEPGEYYFGIHVNSPLANGWRIALRDFKVSLTDQTVEIPAACTGLSVTPDKTGDLKAEVTFTMPSVYINGKSIPATESIDAVIASPIESVTVSGNPGQTVSATVNAADGENIITVTTRNDKGEGIAVKSAVMCGADLPINPVATFSVSDDNMEIHMKWDPVTEGVNGGVVPQDGLTYNVYKYYTTSEMGQWVLFEQGLTDCEYTFRADSENQQLYQLMVSAKNKRGESEGGLESYAAAMLGRPHDMPLNETFPGKTMRYEGLLIDYLNEDYTASWALDSPGSVGATGGPEAALMCLVADGTVGKGYAELPKFSTAGCKKPRIKLNAFISAATPETTLRLHSTEGRGNGVTLGVIDSNSGSGWCELVYELPERYYNKPWVVLSLDVDCQMEGQIFVLGGYEIYESAANDLALLRPSVPAYIRLGEEAPFGVSVQNCGTQSATAPVLKTELYDETGLVMNPELSFSPVTLAENEKTDYTGVFNFDRIEQAGQDYTLRISLPESDENDANNSVKANFRVGMGNMPVAENFIMESGPEANSVELAWDHPYLYGFVDKIESYSHGCHDYRLGDWKNVDCDMANTYYSEGFDIPDAGLPKAFQAVNAVLSGMEGMVQPSGDSFLMAFCPQGATADDWLISPEVEGGSTVMFWMTSLSSVYAETLEVLSSSTDDELDSFNNVLRSVVADVAGWRLISVTLPDDAKYFAIHYASTDQFGVCIDDITYSPIAPSVEITGWNVYRDDVLVKENLDATAFAEIVPEAGKNYSYNVAAVGTMNGKSMVFPKSETLVYDGLSSIGNVVADEWSVNVEAESIIVEGCKGMSVEITDMRGVKLFSVADAAQSVAAKVMLGIYIVTVDGKSRKVIVP